MFIKHFKTQNFNLKLTKISSSLHHATQSTTKYYSEIERKEEF
jgi:hypothetical protein